MEPKLPCMDGLGLYSTLHDAYLSLDRTTGELVLTFKSLHLESFHGLSHGTIQIVVQEPSLHVELWQNEHILLGEEHVKQEKEPNWVLAGDVGDWTELGDVSIVAFCPEGVLAVGLMELDRAECQTGRYLQVIVRGTRFQFLANGSELAIPEFQKLGDEYWKSLESRRVDRFRLP